MDVVPYLLTHIGPSVPLMMMHTAPESAKRIKSSGQNLDKMAV